VAVISGPNIAIANGGKKENECKPCGESRGGDVNQNSGNTVDASTRNFARQSNDQSNNLDQSQAVKGGSSCCSKDGRDVSQYADQSNEAYNTANQSGASDVWVISGPNFAFAKEERGKRKCDWCGDNRGGDVDQNSGNTVDASTRNKADQSNTQSNDLTQTQTVKGRSDCGQPRKDDCKPSCNHDCKPKCEQPKHEHACKPRCNPC
jgi:hypothetical protein